MQFHFQDPGEGIHEAEVRDILVSVGDRVEEGQDVLVVETDKAAFELASPQSGTIEAIAVSPGDVIHVGDPLLTYADEGSESKAKPESSEHGEEDAERAEAKEDRKDESREAKPKARKEREDPETDDAEAEAKEDREDEAEAEAKEDREDEPDAPEEEHEGRELEDTDREAEGKPEATDEKPEDESEEVAAKPSKPKKRADRAERRPVPATPATRRIARETGIPLESVRPSGEAGRVTSDDVRRKAVEKGGEAHGAEEDGSGGLPDFSRWGPTERTPLRSVRRSISRHMARSWSKVPHVTHQDLLDITPLERLRRELSPRIEVRGAKLTLAILVMKALIPLLEKFPRLNASLDDESEEIVLKKYYNLGLATATERGLIVPVVRDVDTLSLSELALKAREVTQRARDGKPTQSDLAGGTFTITNVGSIGGRAFTPIVNYPEVAILGMGRARLENLVEGSIDEHSTRVAYVLPICLAFDHRVIDGAEAARFVTELGETLSNPESFAKAV